MRMIFAAAAVALSACQQAPVEAPAAADTQDGVAMTPDVQARMGVKVGALAAGAARRVSSVYARVVDVGPLAQLDAEAASARSAASASAEEANRLRALAAADQSAAPKAVEAAAAQAGADNARATLAEQRIGLEWGPGLARLGARGRADMLNAVASGQASLVRLDLPNAAASQDIRVITVRATRDGPAIKASSLGPSIAADPRLQAPGVFALVRGGAAAQLPAGRLLYGEVETGAAEAGVVIPREAIVRVAGAPWVYVVAGDNRFVRKEIAGGRPIDSGWFVASGFKAGDSIVIDGAGSLLAVERGPEESE